jgi:hypothetical protein
VQGGVVNSRLSGVGVDEKAGRPTQSLARLYHLGSSVFCEDTFQVCHIKGPRWLVRESFV